MKTPELLQWCAQDRLYWDDMMGNWCCFSAATEESTACTNSHAIKEPTNTQMYKHRHFATVFFFSHLIILALFIIVSLFRHNVVFFWLVTIIWRQIKQCEINPSSAKQLQLSKHSARHSVVHRLKMASRIQLTLSVSYVNTLDVSDNVKFTDSFLPLVLLSSRTTARIERWNNDEQQTGSDLIKTFVFLWIWNKIRGEGLPARLDITASITT